MIRSLLFAALVLICGSAVAREYDAESDIGLVAEDFTPSVAAKNTARLTAALNAQWAGGKFTFVDGHTGPVLDPIRCSGKEFYFSGTIKTSDKIGGVLYGMGSRSYMISSGTYNAGPGSIGGAVTRFTRIDGGATAGNELALLRIRGAGFVVDGIQFLGQRYLNDPTGEGPKGPKTTPKGTKTPVGIEVESHNGDPTTTKTLINNCLFGEFGYGICSRACYYNDKGERVFNESHADLGVVNGCEFVGCDSCYRSENEQSVCWNFNDMVVTGWGGNGYTPTICFDIVRGGDVTCRGLVLDHYAATVFKVNHYSQHTARLVCDGMKWDRGSPAADSRSGKPFYLTLFQFDGAVYADMSWAKWSVRITGNIGNGELKPPAYHTEKLIEIPAAAIKAGFPTGDLLFDITRLPLDNFTAAGGPWVRPKPLAPTKSPGN